MSLQFHSLQARDLFLFMFSLQSRQMYIRGKLLFLGFIFTAQSHTEKDVLKEISRVRGAYRSGLSLPSDYKYRSV